MLGQMLNPLPPTLRLHEAEIAQLCRRYGIKELSLFGSAARGEMGPASDIDLFGRVST
ncbi:MAG: nucleotidyltransferase family protein [Bryobacteraceae bacterium]